VIEQVVPPGEAIAGKSTLASSVEAKVWSVTVTMHAMSFTLVTKQASGRGELLLGACFLPASEGLQVRIDELVVVALQLRSLVRAVLRGLEGAPEESIGVRTFGIQSMSPVATFIQFTERRGGSLGRNLHGLRINLHLGLAWPGRFLESLGRHHSTWRTSGVAMRKISTANIS